MAGRFGNVAGAITQGASLGAGIVNKNQDQQFEREKAEKAETAARIQGLQTQASDNVKNVQNIMSQYVENARAKNTMGTPEFKQGFGALTEQLLKPGDMLTAQNIPSSVPRETLLSYADTLANKPSLEQEQANAASAAGAVTTAKETAKAPFKDAPPPNVQNFEFRDGSEGTSIDMTAKGAPQSVQDALGRGGFRVGTSVVANKVADLIPDKAMDALNEDEIALRGVLGETSRLREQIKEGAFTGLAGGMILGLNSMAGNLAQASRALTGTDDSSLLDPSKYDFRAFGPEAERSAALRSNVTNLAYVLSKSADPGGRISDADVRLQVARIGASAGDPGQMSSSLDEIDRGAKLSYQNRHLVTTRGLDMPLPQDLYPPEAGSVFEQLKAKKPEDVTAEDFGTLNSSEQSALLKHYGYE